MTKTTNYDAAADVENAAWLPSQGLRTIGSLLLFAHLFALGVAMLSNPRDGMTSPLLLRLGGVPFLSSYLQLVWMDLGYDYFHSYGDNEFVAPLSSDHLAEIELRMADGSTQTIVSPDAEVGGLRRTRYTNLWNNSGRTVGQSGIESMLPDMVAESLLRRHSATMATIRVRRRVPWTIEQAQSTNRDETAALRTVYTGIGQLRDGEFLYQKLESVGDTAPAVGASAAPSAAAPSAPRQPATRSAPPGTGPGSGPSTNPRPLFPVDR